MTLTASIPPGVQVVIPTYHRLDLLPRALASVTAQTLRPTEVVVVASDPEERGLVAEAVAAVGDPTMRVVAGTSRLAGSEARNLGWRSGSPPIVMFLDDDDWWLPTKVERHVAAHAARNAAVVYSGVVYSFADAKNNFEKRALPVPLDVESAMLTDGFCPATISCLSITRGAIAGVDGFDALLKSYQDWDLLLRLALANAAFADIPEALIHFSQHEGDRISRDISGRTAASRYLAEKYRGVDGVKGFLRRELFLSVERKVVDLAAARNLQCLSELRTAMGDRCTVSGFRQKGRLLLKAALYLSLGSSARKLRRSR